MALPMPKPTNAPLPLTEYKVLSFDIYGSVIEYKEYILRSFQPLLSRLAPSSEYRDTTPLSTTIPDAATKGSVQFLKLFQKFEDEIKLETPTPQFDEILRRIWQRIAEKLGVETTEEETNAFGSNENISSWPTFPGTFLALKALSQHYKLVALSNIDKYAWNITAHSPVSRLGDVDWWKVFTAEDFGDDLERADEAKLKTLIEFTTSNGIDKKHILHIAQSLGHDQAPAKRLGLSSVWLIGDGPKWGKEEESKMVLEKQLVGYGWRFNDLKTFSNHVEEQFKAEA